jgi:hypothetical protein
MATYFKIETIEVGSGGASSIDFTAIPSTYTDLVVKYSLRDTYAAANLEIWYKFNGATTNYSWRKIQGNGATAISQNGNTDPYIYAGIIPGSSGSTASTFANGEIYIPNYASANYKSSSVDVVSEYNGTTAYAILNANLWSSTSAITSITIVPTTAFAQYSSATLYGISNS